MIPIRLSDRQEGFADDFHKNNGSEKAIGIPDIDDASYTSDF